MTSFSFIPKQLQKGKCDEEKYEKKKKRLGLIVFKSKTVKTIIKNASLSTPALTAMLQKA